VISSRNGDAFPTTPTTRLISVINLSEVLVAPAAHDERLRAAREAIGALGVAVDQPNEAIGIQAAGADAFEGDEAA